MLSKCANPACLARFRYLHEGRIFAIEASKISSETGRSTHKVERFWLCEGCVRTQKIVIENGVVSTRPLRMELGEGATPEAPEPERHVA